jgi:hypothetical protein
MSKNYIANHYRIYFKTTIFLHRKDNIKIWERYVIYKMESSFSKII